MPPGTKKTSISLDPDLEQRAKQRAEQLGFKYSFSAYVASLIRDDIKAHTEPITVKEQPAKYPKPQRAFPRRTIPKQKEN